MQRGELTLACLCASGNRAAPPPPIQTPREEPATKKKEEEEDDDEETSSSSEETESDTEEESETDAHPPNPTPSATSAASQDRQRNESAMARTDIGPLLARSAEARRGSKEDSPSTRQVVQVFLYSENIDLFRDVQLCSPRQVRYLFQFRERYLEGCLENLTLR